MGLKGIAKLSSVLYSVIETLSAIYDTTLGK